MATILDSNILENHKLYLCGMLGIGFPFLTKYLEKP